MSKPYNRQNRISKLSIGLGGFDFSKRIAGKYGVLRRSGRLLSLVFSTPFGKKGDYKKINDNLWFHFGIYLKVIRQLIKTSSYHFQKMENFILKNETPDLSYKSDQIYFFRVPPGQLRERQKNPIFPVRITQFIGSGMQPIEILQLVEKSVPSSYEKEVAVKNATIYENLYKDAHTTNITFLQRASNVGNASSEIKRLIHFQPYGIRSFDKERHSPGLHSIKITNASPEKRIVIREKIIQPLLRQSKAEKIIRYKNLYKNVLGKNILIPSYLISRTVNIALNYARSINYRNLQSIFNTRNSNSEIKRLIHFQPGIRLFDKERRSSGYHAKILNEIQKDSTVILEKTIQPLLQQTKVEKIISFENLYKDAPGKNILFPSYLTSRTANLASNYAHLINFSYLQRSSNVRNINSEIKRVIHFQPGIRSFDKERRSSGSHSAKILNETQKDSTVILEKTIQPLLQQTKVEKIVSYKNLYKNEPGKNILFPSYLTSRTANITSNYAHPINISYLQSIFNTRNSSSEIKRLIHSQAKILDETQKDRTMILGKNIQPLLQQTRVEKIINYKNLYKYAHSSLEMVFKKPVAQSTDIASENKEQLEADRINPNYITDNLIKESLEKKSVHEIGKIADSVYKIIERKILIEKDRRGLF